MSPFFVLMSTVIPTLGENLFLTEPNVQLTYLIRTFSIFPANTMPFLNSSMPSLADLAARFGTDENLLCTHVQANLKTLVENTFPTGIVTVTVNATTEDSVMTLSIRVSVNIDGNVTSRVAIATIKNNQVTIPNDTVDLT